MPNIGPLEIVVVLVIVLVVFGPKRLPELGRSLGRGMREFKQSISGESHDDDRSKLNTGPDVDAGSKPENDKHETPSGG